MTYIPDCRNDETYNFENLTKEDKIYVRGYDWCMCMVADNFFNNLDVYFDDDSYLMHILNEKLPESLQDECDLTIFNYATMKEETEHRKIETYADLLRAKLLDWIEDERDSLITVMIDDQTEKEVKTNE